MSKRGFRIVIAPRAPFDTLFTWHALSVEQPVNFYGNTERRAYELPAGVESDYAGYYGRTTAVAAGTSLGTFVPVPAVLVPALAATSTTDLGSGSTTLPSSEINSVNDTSSPAETTSPVVPPAASLEQAAPEPVLPLPPVEPASPGQVVPESPSSP